MKYALVTGDRHALPQDWEEVIRTAFIDHEITAVIHGAARGIDTIAADLASAMGMPTYGFPAEWRKYGRSAGPKRNTKMLTALREKMKTDQGIVLAFHPGLGGSRGTRNMVQQAMAAGVKVVVYDGTTSITMDPGKSLDARAFPSIQDAIDTAFDNGRGTVDWRHTDA